MNQDAIRSRRLFVAALAASFAFSACQSKVRRQHPEGEAGAPGNDTAGGSLASGSDDDGAGGGTTSGTVSTSVNTSASQNTASGGAQADASADDIGTGASTENTGAGASGSTAGNGGSETVSGTETGTASGSGGLGSCPDQQICVRPVPTDWYGPVVSFHGAEPPDCPESYPELEFDAGDRIVMTGACRCECGEPEISCDQSLSYWLNSDIDCLAGTGMSGSATPSSCTEITGTAVEVLPRKPELSCARGVITDELQARFDNLYRACGGASVLDNCDAGVCVPASPAPFEQQYCIYRAGEHECPESYPTKLQLYDDFDDPRTCPNDCNCIGSGGACVSEAHFFSDPSGTCASSSEYPVETLTLTSAAETCSGEGKLGFSVETVTPAAVPEGSDPAVCNGQDGTPDGYSTRTDPLTLCCVQ